MAKSREGQNILDYTMQEFGSIENAIEVIVAGNFGLTDEIPAGTDLKLETANKGDQGVKDYYSKKALVTNNAAPATTGDAYSSAYSNAYN
jgi:hypothetical protein